jgi:hypothetical protein
MRSLGQAASGWSLRAFPVFGAQSPAFADEARIDEKTFVRPMLVQR